MPQCLAVLQYAARSGHYPRSYKQVSTGILTSTTLCKHHYTNHTCQDPNESNADVTYYLSHMESTLLPRPTPQMAHT